MSAAVHNPRGPASRLEGEDAARFTALPELLRHLTANAGYSCPDIRFDANRRLAGPWRDHRELDDALTR
jgi:hypothetical protein